ncbi:lipase family protein [Sorangium sp. So ce726]|uniref:lipase family protein n=1 Tax=Sorangium sp. So ce726 TaxID=3133319 RepID=UPI003F5F50D7
MDFQSAQAPDYQSFVENLAGASLEEDIKEIFRRNIPSDDALAGGLFEAIPGRYDPKIAALLASAAAWAYSDADSMARMLRVRGLPNNRTVTIHWNNEGVLVDTTAHVVQSGTGKVVILCFSGTRVTNLVQVLASADMRWDPFFSAGSVHGGFFRALLALWPSLKILLDGALQGHSICDMIQIDAAGHRCPTRFDEDGAARPAPYASRPEGGGALETLYITGHSFGAALAVLAAAAIHTEPALVALKEKLGGVYTFGQPMVGDEVFAAKFSKIFGDRLFRHVHRNDVIPRLPGRMNGRFAHFGNEYRSSATGWKLAGKGATPRQTTFGTIATLIGMLGWLLDLPVPYSMEDHMPLQYLRTSMRSAPGSEFLP